MAERAKRFVIVGNGVAGTTCAETLRKNDSDCEITLIGDERWPLYNRVALPPYIKGKATRQKVFLRTLEQHAQRGINLLLETRVTKINHEEQTVLLNSGQELPYDALLVATGGRPNHLQVSGAEGASNVFNFQYFDDAEAILDAIHTSKRAAVTGGSYIAYELAEGFREQGLEVFWLHRGPHFLRRVLDPEGGALVDDIAEEHGVHMLYGSTITACERDNGKVKAIVESNGQRIDVDMVGAGLGVKLNVELFKELPGVEIRDGVVTNAYLETGVPNVYAAGDVAEFFDKMIDRHNILGTWGNSIGHGRTVAVNMLGQRTAYEDIPMYSSTLFDSYIRVIGLTPETGDDLESFEHLNAQVKSYQRLFFFDGRLVGAVLIGDMRFRQRIFAAIKSREQIPPDERRQLLA
ncbi:MAG TPA: FAD-dependent oxidoreductase [Chloroflexota bacterium]|nr:FAD-dependent oxidoreductase [Chloroflexota bacterium]